MPRRRRPKRRRKPIPGADISPLVPAGRQVIQGYGEGRFRIAGTVHTGSVVVRLERTEPWPVAEAAEITMASLAGIAGGRAQILLVGCGARFLPIPAGFGDALSDAGVALEWMDTGAACRTFNVLLADERQVVAALIAVR